jgi:hypothetical protein
MPVDTLLENHPLVKGSWVAFWRCTYKGRVHTHYVGPFADEHEAKTYAHQHAAGAAHVSGFRLDYISGKAVQADALPAGTVVEAPFPVRVRKVTP